MAGAEEEEEEEEEEQQQQHEQLPPLVAAAAHGDVAALERLLGERAAKKRQEDNQTKEEEGDREDEAEEDSILEMALWGACSNKHPAAVKLLLDEGADPSAADDNGFNALMWAAEAGSLGCVKHILENARIKVDVNAKTVAGGCTPLIMTCDGDRSAEDLEICRLLLDHGADINASDFQNATALMFAVQAGNYDLVKFLLDNGARVTAPAAKKKHSESSKPDKTNSTLLSDSVAEDDDYDFDDEDGEGANDPGAEDDDIDGSNVFETVFDVLSPDDDEMRSLLDAAAQREGMDNSSSAECKRQRTE